MQKWTLVAFAACGAALISGACEPELSDDTTAAAAAVNTGVGPSSGAGAGGQGGAGGRGGAGGQSEEVHGCTRATAEDRTGSASVLINDISNWGFNHSACVVVDPGTVVRWEGNFGTHPLAGGITPTQDAQSPITGNTPMNDGVEFVAITFPDAGDFPYFCTVHTTTMTGVVYVAE